jgi:hypothetical protein
MAHYAKLDENNLVKAVIVVNNEDEMLNGVESEAKGVAFCQNLTGHMNWKKTSYNANIRKNYAGIGFTYDSNLDAFVPPKPFPSWQLDSKVKWISPTPMPSDGLDYRWNEESLSWVLFKQKD